MTFAVAHPPGALPDATGTVVPAFLAGKRPREGGDGEGKGKKGRGLSNNRCFTSKLM